MTGELKIEVGGLAARGWLNDTDTATKVLEILPLTSAVNVWGEEIYFSIPVKMGPEDAKETVELGDIAYWPQGSALCIFFGTTPVSQGDEIRPISPVNVVGRVEVDRDLYRGLLQELERGAEISISV